MQTFVLFCFIFISLFAYDSDTKRERIWMFVRFSDVCVNKSLYHPIQVYHKGMMTQGSIIQSHQMANADFNEMNLKNGSFYTDFHRIMNICRYESRRCCFKRKLYLSHSKVEQRRLRFPYVLS